MFICICFMNHTKKKNTIQFRKKRTERNVVYCVSIRHSIKSIFFVSIFILLFETNIEFVFFFFRYQNKTKQILKFKKKKKQDKFFACNDTWNRTIDCLKYNDNVQHNNGDNYIGSTATKKVTEFFF